MSKLKIGITVGDMCGIGPEIVEKILQDKEITGLAELVIIGPEYFVCKLAGVQQIAVGDLKEQDITLGKVDPKAGKAAIEYVEKAIELCQQGQIAAMVTAPINKEAVHAAGNQLPGHTEILAKNTKTTKYAMAFYSEKLKVILNTIHVPLIKVPSLLTRQKTQEKIELADQFIKDLGIEKPRIAVAGLNPHAGGDGSFGKEEQTILAPAVENSRKKGIDVSGPYPGDTVFKQAVDGKFDIVVAQYHDQGLIPLKLLAFDNAVNVTVGLPIIRTSVDHGTAFDIVGQNKADPGSLKEAVKLAVRLAKNKK